jgi:hypothetical protein
MIEVVLMSSDAVPSSKVGRVGVFNQATAAKVIAYVRKGLTYDRAAEAVGISPRTIESWRDRKPGFAVAIKKARRELESECLDTIKEAGEKSWQARAWIAERVFGYAQPSSRLEVAGAIAHGATPQLASMLANMNLTNLTTHTSPQVIDCQASVASNRIGQGVARKARKARRYSKRPTPPRPPGTPPAHAATHIPPLQITDKNKKDCLATATETNGERDQGTQQAA